MNTAELAKVIATPNKLGQLVLSPSRCPGDFDSCGVDVPFPFRYRGQLYMTYVGFDGEGYRTGWAESADGIVWKKKGLLVDRGVPGSPTQYNIALTSILREGGLFDAGELVRVNGRFLATWHAYPEVGYEEGKAVIGLAWSNDLEHWELTDPVLEAAESWEAASLYKSALFFADGKYFLFYNAKEVRQWPWHEQIGLAWSYDLIHWHKHPENPLVTNGADGAPDAQFAADPQVFSYQDGYVMFYYGLGINCGACELAAWSTDLIRWQKLPEPLISPGAIGSADAMHAHKPGVITVGGRLYHYYCAVAPVDAQFYSGLTEIRGISLAW